ncbi:MAG: hypothetical protein Ct9H300mP19_06870 [Dehalococcoidia bacterium]|nr:MAG: hypothetical protein Ct9H300mP19_06870 [Dehalococcoidia bacterium]
MLIFLECRVFLNTVLSRGLVKFFRMADESISIEKMVETYRAIDTKAVIFSFDAETKNRRFTRSKPIMWPRR